MGHTFEYVQKAIPALCALLALSALDQPFAPVKIGHEAEWATLICFGEGGKDAQAEPQESLRPGELLEMGLRQLGGGRKMSTKLNKEWKSVAPTGHWPRSLIMDKWEEERNHGTSII